MEPDFSLRLDAFVVVEVTALRLVALSMLGLLTSSEPTRDTDGLVGRDLKFSVLRLDRICFVLVGSEITPSSGSSEPASVAV